MAGARSSTFSVKSSRPAPSAVTRAHGASAALARTALGVDQRAQVVETVRGDHARRRPVPRDRLRLRTSVSAFRARCPQKITRRELRRRSSTSFAPRLNPLWPSDFRAVVAASHPVGVIAHEKGDGRNAARDNAAAAFAVVVQHRGMRRQAAPSHCAPQTKIVQGSGIVVGNAALENLAFPGIGGRFVALQLAQDLQRSAFSERQRARERRAASAPASA